MLNKRFPATLSHSSLLLSVATIIGAFVIMANSIFNKHSNDLYIFGAVFLLVMVGIMFLIRPLKYIITDNYLIIDRLIFRKKIQLEQITSFEKIDYSDLAVNIKLMGSNGFLGHFGFYCSTKWGILRMNATNLKALVMIKTNASIFAISPDQGSQFLEEIKVR